MGVYQEMLASFLSLWQSPQQQLGTSEYGFIVYSGQNGWKFTLWGLVTLAIC